MITFNNIVERFEDFATSHFFIKSFSFGSPDDVDLAKFTEFPLMHLVYTGATYDSGTKTYNIEVYILDVPADKTDKVERQREVVSDAEQCAEDIIADIRMGGNIFTFAQDYEVVNATTTPLEEETKNVLSGVLLDLSVAIPYEWDACNAPIDGVSPEGGDEPSYARRGFLRMLTLDGSTDVLSVRTIKVTNGTLTDDGDGVVTLDTGGVETLEDLTDTNIISPSQGSVISYNSGVQKWMVNNGLQELLQKFKASGTGAQMYDTLNDTTKGYIDILASSATMKVNHSGMTISEASPGVLSFSVAAGTEGNEVEFEAMTIEGSDAVSTVADINFKQGSLTYWENATGKIWLRAPNAGNLTVLLPSSSGTIALTTDIPNVPVDSVNGQTGVVVLDTGDIDENGNLYYTEARVAANSAVAANTAKVGITQTQADDITANNAKVGITAQQASDITTNNAKVGVIAGGTTGQALVKASGTDYDLEWADAASGVQYHERFATDAETFRSGATETVELYYTAKADGDGLAESASSDTPTAGKIIKRKIYYSEAAFADPDTGTWVEFTPAPADDASFATVKAALLEYLKARTGGTVPISLKQTWEEVSQTAYLLDQSYGSGAEAAYSTRQLRNAATDCMVIRRASDSTTTTIGFDGSGNISEADIISFCTGTTCTVYQWLDQSGNGNTATAAAPANEPTIYTGGALVKENGRVALDFDGTNDYFITSNGVANETELTIFQAGSSNPTGALYANQTVYSIPHSIPASTPWARVWISQYNTSDVEIRNNGTPYLFNNVYPQNETILTLNTKQGVFNVNGTLAATFTGADITYPNVMPFIIGANGAGTQNWKGNNQEVLVFGINKSGTDQTSIEENVGDYFTQNTPLLDTYTGAAAAYSLRKLRTAYTGDAVEVYNGSSYASIGFNVFGELDTVALAAHCGSNDGFIRTWYDQGTNGNDATQSTTANMPKIYDGTTGVVTENGKPAVEFDGSDDFITLTSDVLQTDANLSIFSIAKHTESTVEGGLYDLAGPLAIVSFSFNRTASNSYGTANFRGGVVIGTDGDSYNQVQSLFTQIGTASTNDVYRDGVQSTQAYSARGSFKNEIGRASVSYYLSGTAQEFVIYPAAKSSTDQTGIETNIATFYDITI